MDEKVRLALLAAKAGPNRLVSKAEGVGGLEKCAVGEEEVCFTFWVAKKGTSGGRSGEGERVICSWREGRAHNLGGNSAPLLKALFSSIEGGPSLLCSSLTCPPPPTSSHLCHLGKTASPGYCSALPDLIMNGPPVAVVCAALLPPFTKGASLSFLPSSPPSSCGNIYCYLWFGEYLLMHSRRLYVDTSKTSCLI